MLPIRAARFYLFPIICLLFLRLTDETMVLEKGKVIKRAPSLRQLIIIFPAGFAETGERRWEEDEIPINAAPSSRLHYELKTHQGLVVNTVRSVEEMTIEFEYELSSANYRFTGRIVPD